MDTKNVIAAISLSAAVIILYSLFFAPPPVTKENFTENNKTARRNAFRKLPYPVFDLVRA